MSRAEEIIKQLSDISKHPRQAMNEYKKKTGKGAIGVLPIYAPEEIVYATGYLPMGIWGGEGAINKAAQFLPSFACSIMQIIMEFECGGIYDDLAAVLISSPCDTLKAIGQKWKGTSPVIQFVHSQNRDFEGSDTYMAAEYRTIKDRLEKILRITIADADVNAAIEVYNENRSVMRLFTEVAAQYPQLIGPVERHAVIKSRQFMDKAEHTVLVRELVGELLKEKPEPFKGKKVVLTGIMAEPDSFLEVLKEYHVAVVADDLAQESRQFRTDVPAGRDPYVRLAKQWRDVTACSLATDRKKPRSAYVAELVKLHGADAAIYCQMKFCDPEEYDYPMMLDTFKEQGIPNIKIEIDLQAVAVEQLRTRIQSFVEML